MDRHSNSHEPTSSQVAYAQTNKYHATGTLSRKPTPTATPIPLYSKEDIREQYCITNKQLDVFEQVHNDQGGFFGCLSQNIANSPCSNKTDRSSILSVCVRRKVPSDENLYDLYKHRLDYAPFHRHPGYSIAPYQPDLYFYDDHLDYSYFRRRPRSFYNLVDPRRYTWMPEDEDFLRMERPRSVRSADYFVDDLLDYQPFKPRSLSRQSTISNSSAGFAQHPHFLSLSNEYLPSVHGAGAQQHGLIPGAAQLVCLAHPSDLPPPPPPPPPPPQSALIQPDAARHMDRTKHVSFARSQTLASFDDGRTACRGHERLLDGRKTVDVGMLNKQTEEHEVQRRVTLEKQKRGQMKAQATQTDVFYARKPIVPSQLLLSPRTIHRVRMVSQGAQTNGNGRTLAKSFSETGTQQSPIGTGKEHINGTCKVPEHEPLMRTQSEEPKATRTPLQTPERDMIDDVFEIFENDKSPKLFEAIEAQLGGKDATEVQAIEESSEESESKNEIIIDFEPQLEYKLTPPPKKRVLLKTMSEGEILQEQRKSQITDVEMVMDEKVTSVSHENIKMEGDDDDETERVFMPYFLSSPILNEDICKKVGGLSDVVVRALKEEESSDDKESISSPSTYREKHRLLHLQDSIEEVFHENYICRGTLFRKDSVNQSDGPSSVSDSDYLHVTQRIPSPKSTPTSPRDETKVGARSDDKHKSPFASCDSLDQRDQSEGNWNESQATVLQLDSENGNAVSSSELSSLTTVTSPQSANLLTPSSRRRYLLIMQHQQRSSMDTEALDKEEEEKPTDTQSPTATTITTPTISITTHKDPPKVVQTTLKDHRTRRQAKTPDHTPSDTPYKSTESLDKYEALQRAAELLVHRVESNASTKDVSESTTTTTDDYVTANSDSSRRSGSLHGLTHSTQGSQTGTQDGSSFESASSVHSLARGEAVYEDFQLGPSFSPPPILEEEDMKEDEEQQSRSRSSSGSSSGSYSLKGSRDMSKDQKPDEPTVPHNEPVAIPTRITSLSDDDRSIHYSSGYYESPVDDRDENKRRKLWKKPSDRKDRGLSEEEKKKRKKALALEIVEIPKKTKDRSGKKPKGSPRSAKKPLRTIHTPEEWSNKVEVSFTITKPAITSDESSGTYAKEEVSTSLSPRRPRRFRDTRRKSGPIVTRRKSIDDQITATLPLPRRQSVVPLLEPNGIKTIPRKTLKTGPKDCRLKAISAESLRSASPGSDSVFYSEGSNAMKEAESYVHCLHCGKEVDIVTTDDPKPPPLDDVEIVKPPEGFADSPDGPRTKPNDTKRLFKKFEKRYRSEERRTVDRRHHLRFKQDLRAKFQSEERGKEEEKRARLRPLVRSTGNSYERLKQTLSSPSVAVDGDQDEMDCDSFKTGKWVFIGDNEELKVWQKGATGKHYHDDDSSQSQESISKHDSITSLDSTGSEHEFRKRYQCVTHRMVHRRSCLEMYKRQAKNTFKTDKTVIVHRDCGEFGFRIHGSKPVVVSAIEPSTPAETSGLEVGDIIIAVNGVNVLDKSHSEVVTIAHSGADVLELEVARTCDVIAGGECGFADSLFAGYLWKYVKEHEKWVRRWFCLKRDNCLYYYKSDADLQPIGALMLINYDIDKPCAIAARPFSFALRKTNALGLCLAADTDESSVRWRAVISHAIQNSNVIDTWLDKAKRYVHMAADAIDKPDCFGYLWRLSNQFKNWTRVYCMLKDACMYFYQDASARNAINMVCLNGYRVQQMSSSGKKYAFEVIPPSVEQKYFYFHTDSDFDRKRWIAALEYSIDRWFRVDK